MQDDLGGGGGAAGGGKELYSMNNSDESRLKISHQGCRHHCRRDFARKEKARGPGAVTGGGHG